MEFEGFLIVKNQFIDDKHHLHLYYIVGKYCTFPYSQTFNASLIMFRIKYYSRRRKQKTLCIYKYTFNQSKSS